MEAIEWKTSDRDPLAANGRIERNELLFSFCAPRNVLAYIDVDRPFAQNSQSEPPLEIKLWQGLRVHSREDDAAIGSSRAEVVSTPEAPRPSVAAMVKPLPPRPLPDRRKAERGERIHVSVVTWTPQSTTVAGRASS